MINDARIIAIATEYDPHIDKTETIQRTAVFSADTPAIKILEWAYSTEIGKLRNRIHLSIHFDESQPEVLDELKEREKEKYLRKVSALAESPF